jgi:tetratricopeptide (TPR) repeat protein
MDRLPLSLPEMTRWWWFVFAGMISVAQAQPVADLIRQGDALDAKNQSAKALAIYREAEKLEPGNADVLRLISKQYAQQMVDAGAADKQALGGKALDYAKRAVQAGPENAQAHLSLAIVYGKIAFLQPAKERVKYSRLIKQEVEKSIGLDSQNDLAWHVLGRWHYEVANLSAPLKFFAQTLYGKMPEASNEQALECFQKAVALNPKRLMNEAELGRTLAILGRKDQARAALEKALEMPSREKDDDETKTRAKKALAALD